MGGGLQVVTALALDANGVALGVLQHLVGSHQAQSEAALQRTRFEVVLATADAYLTLAAAGETVRASQAGVDSGEVVLKTIRALVDNGTYVIGRRDPSLVTSTNRYGDEGIVQEEGWPTIDKVLIPETNLFYSSKPPFLPTILAGEYWLLKHA